MRFISIILILGIFVVSVSACTRTPYRLPYVNGTEVQITQDHTTHTTPEEKMFDIRATTQRQTLAAAKSGWVRYVKETGNSSAATNNYVWIEHPLDYCQPSGSAPPGNGGLATTCKTCSKGLGRCNEWTLYAHMEQNSVSAAGVSVGDWVTAGQPIGIESDVGKTFCAPGVTTPLCGRHVHFAVWKFEVDSALAKPTDLFNPKDDDGDYEEYAEMYGRPEVVPLFCTAQGLRYPRQNDVHIAANCP